MSLPYDWFLLLLRVLFIGLLYFFLFQVVRLTARELVALATTSAPDAAPDRRYAEDRLVVVDPAESGLPVGTSFLLEPLTVIGRHPRCTLAIDEAFVSSAHAELTIAEGCWWLRDLNSTNGTFLNGQAVQGPTSVREGDIVQLGRVKLQLVG